MHKHVPEYYFWNEVINFEYKGLDRFYVTNNMNSHNAFSENVAECDNARWSMIAQGARFTKIFQSFVLGIFHT